MTDPIALDRVQRASPRAAVKQVAIALGTARCRQGAPFRIASTARVGSPALAIVRLAAQPLGGLDQRLAVRLRIRDLRG
jgi:hypothetical protein